MATEKLESVLGIAGNIGLILGLLLVGYQIKQTNDLAKAQMISDGNVMQMTLDLAFIGEQGPEALSKADYSASDLSDQDVLLLERMYRARITEQLRVIGMREFGLTSMSEIAQAQEFAYESNSAFGRMYWDIAKDGLPLTATFIAEVDRTLAEIDQDNVDLYRRELTERER